jgi:hypothetical protein
MLMLGKQTWDISENWDKLGKSSSKHNGTGQPVPLAVCQEPAADNRSQFFERRRNAGMSSVLSSPQVRG